MTAVEFLVQRSAEKREVEKKDRRLAREQAHAKAEAELVQQNIHNWNLAGGEEKTKMTLMEWMASPMAPKLPPLSDDSDDD